MHRQGCWVAAAMVAGLLGWSAQAHAATAWAPAQEIIPAGGVSGVHALYVLPDGTAGALTTGGGVEARDLGPLGAPLGTPLGTLGPDLDSGGIAESPARTTLVWVDEGKVQMAERTAGAPAFGPPTPVPTTTSWIRGITTPDANAAGAEVFAYADPTGDDPVVHLVSRAAGSSSWSDETLFDGAHPIGAGVSDSGRIVLGLYADGSYWLTSADWNGEFTEPEWVGDRSDFQWNLTFAVNGPGDALLAWNVGEQAWGDDADQYLTAHLTRDGVVTPATPVPGADRNTEDGAATLDDSGRVTIAYARSARSPQAGVLFTVERRPDGTYTAPVAPGGFVVPSLNGYQLASDAAGNVILSWGVDTGKVGVEAARRSPNGTWEAPQDVRIPCFAAGRVWSVVDLRVHGGSSTLALAEFQAGGGSVGAQYLIARERPAANAGRVCGVPRFATSPYAPPPGPYVPPPTVTSPAPRPPRGQGQVTTARVLRLTSLRVVARPRRSSRSVRVRVGCSRACTARVSIVHTPSRRTLAAKKVRLDRPGSRETTMQMSRGAARVWRRAKVGTVQLRAEATSPGAKPGKRATALRPRS